MRLQVCTLNEGTALRILWDLEASVRELARPFRRRISSPPQPTIASSRLSLTWQTATWRKVSMALCPDP